jgi:hypothetical protein
MSLPDPKPTLIDCIFENILGFMLPFFLCSAGGDADLARAAIQEMAEAYNATTATELELVGRIIGFNIVSMDNLRLSMNREMSLTKVLQYRSNAVALSRAGEQCRIILEAMQDNRKVGQKPMTIPSPSIAAAPPPVAQAKPNEAAPRANKANHHAATHAPTSTATAAPQTGGRSAFPECIEAAKQDARMLLALFAKNSDTSAQMTAIFPGIPDPGAAVSAAVRQALAASGRKVAA